MQESALATAQDGSSARQAIFLTRTTPASVFQLISMWVSSSPPLSQTNETESKSTYDISTTQGGLPLALIVVVVMFSGVGVVSGLLVVAREQKRNARLVKIQKKEFHKN